MIDLTVPKTIVQYQLVDTCLPYDAVQSGSQCLCSNYTTIFCDLAAAQENKSSFPMYVIAIAAVVGVAVIVVVSYLVFKKFFSAASKRTPYIYDPVELMSF